jgi:hypothetical protein
VVECASLQRLSCVAFPAAASTSAARRVACSLSLAMAHSQRYTPTTTTQLLLPFLMPPPGGAAPLSPLPYGSPLSALRSHIQRLWVVLAALLLCSRPY